MHGACYGSNLSLMPMHGDIILAQYTLLNGIKCRYNTIFAFQYTKINKIDE